MAVPSVTTGRGAWSTVAKGNRSRYYEYIAGTPLDGANPTKDVNFQAVNLGVKAIQNRINAFDYSPALVADGYLGSKSRAGIIWVQQRLGLVADGQAGPATCRALWRDLVGWFSAMRSAPASHVWGIMLVESMGDPGAVGYNTPSDRGLVQVNLVAHSNITPEQAFDPAFAIDYAAKRVGDARSKYGGKGADLQTKCSIAQHNAPAWAKQWYDTGQPPNEKIAAYVEKVLTSAKSY